MGSTYKPRRYYSARTNSNPELAQLSFDSFKSLFRSGYEYLQEVGYFTEAFGFWCVDENDVPGTAGSDVPNYVLFHTRKHLWPVEANVEDYSEDDVFDLIEFLYDHVSKPTDGHLHSYGSCGMHWTKFDKAAGQEEFRTRLNPLLESYGSGYELNDKGEIMQRATGGMDKLLKVMPPSADSDALARMKAAIDQFQRHKSTIDERRHAVRDLADVLEKLRPEVKEALKAKDEADLFNIANNFGIRHFNEKQRTDYDQVVWLSWMFYFFVATINACLHILDRKAKSAQTAAGGVRLEPNIESGLSR